MSEDGTNTENKSSLVSRNITVSGRRTSVRLEPEMWCELKAISEREHCTTHGICSLISLRKNKRTSLTAAIRVFLMLYYRASSTENGHDRAGHGNFDTMKRRAGFNADWTELRVVSNTEGTDQMSRRFAAHLPSEEKFTASRAV